MGRALIGVLLALPAALAAQGRDGPKEPALGALPDAVAGVVAEFCADCHGGKQPEAALDLTALPRAPLAAGLTTLLRVRDRVRAGEMPPADYGEPSAAQVQALVAAVDALVDARRGDLHKTPAPAARRGSRWFYQRAVHDLFGVGVPLAAEFPADDLNFGFDSVAGALSFTELHVEKYLAAAEQVAQAVVDDLDPQRPPTQRCEVESLVGDERGVRADGEHALFLSLATLRTSLPVSRAGRYAVRVRGHGDQAGTEAARLRLEFAGDAFVTAPRTADVAPKSSTEFAVAATRKQPVVVAREVMLAQGELSVALTFVNDFYREAKDGKPGLDRNLAVDWLELVGPLDRQPLPAGSRWWWEAGDGRPAGERLRAMLAPLVERAWRRPASAATLAPLLAVAERARQRGESFELQVRSALVALLLSPRFLLRIAVDQRPAAYKRAERLAALLWSSVPDAALLARARADALRTGDDLRAELRRMLLDSRADALASDFAAQWLELRQLEARDDLGALAADLQRETEHVFGAVLREARDVRDLLDADFTFVNARLAAHYGLPGQFGADFVRVDGLPQARRGLLGQGSILVLTSNPTRTSPVKRGKWILENLLDAPVPAPPPGNDSFAEGAVIDSSATLRAQMAAHAERAACAVCHVRMDGLGLALERFDHLGRYRDRDAAGPIDDLGVLAGGRRVQGAAQLRTQLRGETAFLRALASKLYLRAVGQPLGPPEQVRLDVALRALPAGKVTLQELLELVVTLAET